MEGVMVFQVPQKENTLCIVYALLTSLPVLTYIEDFQLIM